MNFSRGLTAEYDICELFIMMIVAPVVLLSIYLPVLKQVGLLRSLAQAIVMLMFQRDGNTIPTECNVMVELG